MNEYVNGYWFFGVVIEICYSNLYSLEILRLGISKNVKLKYDYEIFVICFYSLFLNVLLLVFDFVRWLIRGF